MASSWRCPENRDATSVRAPAKSDHGRDAALSVGIKIGDQDGATIEEVMAAAMEEFVIGRKAEKELETKIIRFPKR